MVEKDIYKRIVGKMYENQDETIILKTLSQIAQEQKRIILRNLQQDRKISSLQLSQFKQSKEERVYWD